jgi:hypothetical protein
MYTQAIKTGNNMPETPKPELITEVPAHLRADAGEATEVQEVQPMSATDRVELGARAAGRIVRVVERLPRVPIAPENVTPQMRANALGSPDRRDELGRIVPR